MTLKLPSSLYGIDGKKAYEKIINGEEKPKKLENPNFPDLSNKSFIFSYDGPHKDYFQELIAKHNKIYSGTEAEIPEGDTGEIHGDLIKRLGLITTIYNNPQLKSVNLWPITPTQSEILLKAGKLTNPQDNWEDLGMILYDKSQKGYNPKEANALYESLKKHRQDLRLSESDLKNRLIIVNAGAEIDSSMPHGIKPTVLLGLTQVYQHEVLKNVGKDSNFGGYGLNGGLPLISQLKSGDRTLYMPDEKKNIGLRVLYRFRDLGLGAWDRDLANSDDDGRVNFAPQGLR